MRLLRIRSLGHFQFQTIFTVTTSDFKVLVRLVVLLKFCLPDVFLNSYRESISLSSSCDGNNIFDEYGLLCCNAI
jgi:hypothetical protein